ncbi:MAG: M1 family metallopeptidase [Acidobacteriota bacterium]|nr:M1 family metallopeptidase [Acidobacteriota bacterium]
MKIRKIYLTALFVLLFVLPLLAQQTKNFNRARTYDVQHYTIRTSFDRATQTVFGDTSIQLKPLKADLATVELDAAGFKYDFVRLENSGVNLQYRQAGEKLVITLDKAYAPKDLISIRIGYSCQPQKGVHFVEPLREKTRVIRAAQIWTQGEPEEAHHWFPSYDFPDDKATTEQFLTVEADETAIANGELLETLENTNGKKTFHYKMNVPHSVYLTSFVIGKYAKLTDSYKNIPLGFYVYPGREATARKAFAKTKNMMRIYENFTGIAFPYSKYDQTVVANFEFGGMENITATTHADTEIFAVDYMPDETEDLVSHELAHSWFGNLVTCRNWAELWLNEGFATFMEAAYREKAYGRADYLRKIKEDAQRYIIEEAVNKNRHGLFNRLARPDDSLFDTTTYQKGGAVVHTLREEIGDAAFWKAINIYLNRHKFANVETPDLKKAMEEASSQDLTWFFNQWIYQGGFPKLEVRQAYDSRRKRLNLTITQTQKSGEITPAAFILPMEIEIAAESGAPKTEKIRIDKRKQSFSIPMDAAPTEIRFDKDMKIPLKSVRILPLTNSKGD